MLTKNSQIQLRYKIILTPHGLAYFESSTYYFSRQELTKTVLSQEIFGEMFWYSVQFLNKL